MPRPRPIRRRVVAGLSGLALVLSVGTASAYWTGGGIGAGASTTGTLAPVTLMGLVAETPSSTLVPGGPAGDVVAKIDNQNAFNVTLVSIAASGPVTASNGCTPTGVSLTTPTNLPLTITPGTNVYHLAGAATMGPTSASACQGATFSIPITITVHK
jgi:hypothetical protein